MANAAAKLLEKFTRPLLPSAAADTALWVRFQQRRATTLQPPTTKSTATSWLSAFDQLEHCKQSPQKEEAWALHPEMTPRKVERGRQLDRGQESHSKSVGQSEQGSGWPASQKRRSQSQPQDEPDSKKAWTECEGKNHMIQVGMDGEIFGGRVRPTSALAKYVMHTINPWLKEGYKVTWERFG